MDAELFNAIRSENVQAVKSLVERGANVNPTAGVPLIMAILKKNMEMVKILVEGGANLDVKTRDELYPLDYAAIYDDSLDIAAYLLEKGANVNLPFMKAIERKNLGYVEQWIAFEADVNFKDQYGQTPLEIAIDSNDINIIKLLIEKGADINFVRPPGFTYLMTVIRKIRSGDTDEVPMLLIEKGATLDNQITAGGFLGYTALMFAAEHNLINVVKLLLEKGANKTLKNAKGKTALDLASTNEMRDLLADPEPESTSTFKGFTKSDVDLFNTIFEKPSDISLCPVCLDYTERKDGCMYMFHKCTRPHKKLFNLYAYTSKYGERGVEWCTLCGRPSRDHHHYMYAEPDSKTLPEFTRVQPTTTGEFRFFDKDCKASGGGGNEEKVRRFNRMLHYACELQSEVGKISEKEGREELIEETWKGANLRQRNVPKILEQKKFDFPCEFPADKLEASAEEVYPDVKKPEGLQPNPIKHDTDGDRDCTVELGEHDDHRPVYQFIHKQPDGTTIDHKDEYICVPDLINGIKASEINGKCPITAECKGKIYPEELKDIVPTEFYETYRKLFNKANAIKTGGGGNFFTHVGDDALCAMPPKKAGKRRKTYRKKKASKRTRKH